MFISYLSDLDLPVLAGEVSTLSFSVLIDFEEDPIRGLFPATNGNRDFNDVFAQDDLGSILSYVSSCSHRYVGHVCICELVQTGTEL